MKDRKLISMVDFLIKQDVDFDLNAIDQLEEIKVRYNRNYRYAKFFQQELKLGDFIPCDKDGKPLEKPHLTIYSVIELKEYQQAKERVIFEGLNYKEMKDYYVVYNEKLNGEIWYSWNKSKTIEDLMDRELTLTESKAKQLGL